MDMIPVHRPSLPLAENIFPYLKTIDSARWYSNFGPLLIQFEERLSSFFDVESSMLTTAANGTLMLVAMLRALMRPEKSLCIMPSWTFVATPAAASYAGLTPYFVDVNPKTQALDPDSIERELSHINAEIGAIIVVAPFGAPLNVRKWLDFKEANNIPIIIDAAASFDSFNRIPGFYASDIPTMISLHATKLLGIGEGGLLISTNRDYVRQVKTITNFGFTAARESHTLGFNAKLAEYAAAVGLAALDAWPATKAQWQSVRNHYIKALNTVNITHTLSPEWISSTCNIVTADNVHLSNHLQKANIGIRKWWNNGCHLETAFADCPRSKNLEATQWLSQSILGIPYSLDLDRQTINAICDVITQVTPTKIAHAG